MASPVGHVIVGVGVAGAVGSALGADPSAALWMGAAIASCLPDLDFLPCAWGAPHGRVHRQGTHSALVLGLLAGLVWTGASGLGFGPDWRVMAGWVAALFSHLILDVLCTGPAIARADFGIPLLWPLSRRRWYVRRPVVPETDLLAEPSLRAILRACLGEVLRLSPAAFALIFLGHLR